jgi:translation initiation factor 2B subunit (eIF-2B alpha/beta/delta family)
MTALANRVHRAMDAAADTRTAAAVEQAAHDGIGRAVEADRRAAANAAERLAGETVLTLSRSGTVERALSTPNLPPGRVYVAESRPAREGVGVAERLARAGIDVTLVTDAAAAHVLAGGTDRAVDRVVGGADTVLVDGGVVNKTGTRGVAIAAVNEAVPVDVVTSADKVAAAGTATVPGEEGPATAVYDGDAELQVENPTFDRTPATFVTGVVTERGVLDADGVATVADEHRSLASWQA